MLYIADEPYFKEYRRGPKQYNRGSITREKRFTRAI